MKIRLLTGIVSRDFKCHEIGDEVDWLPDEEAARLIERRAAVACDPTPVKRAIETAVANPPENAALPNATGKVQTHGRHRS